MADGGEVDDGIRASHLKEDTDQAREGLGLPTGEVETAHAETAPHSMDAPEPMHQMLDRIMKKRKPAFSEGGMVANSDHGEDDEDLAGFSPNEFDDLALRDELESSYTSENSGDETGDSQETKDREDEVARIMRMRRAKQQRTPSPA